MIGIFLSYIGALLICAAGAVGGILLIKKQKIHFQIGAFALGIISAILSVVAIILLFRLLFAGRDYYNTVFFRTLVGSVILSILCGLRFLLLRSTCFNRDREDGGYSFGFGFGFAPLLFVGLYLLIMTLILAGNCLFNGPCIIEEAYLSFADNTIISIFRPVAGHISFALIFAFYAGLVWSSCKWNEQLNVTRYSTFVTIAVSVLLFVFEGISLLLVPFMKMYGLSHWQLAICVGVFSALSLLLVHFAPKAKEKDSTYTKQFE